MVGARQGWTLLGLEWLAAVNFRTALIGVAPILPLLLAGTHLSHTLGGLLFATPLLMFGLFAIPGGLLADRFGPQRLIAGCLLGLALFGALRAAPWGNTGLFLCTCAFGAAIGLGQPALPQVVKLHFADRCGTATALYSSGYMVGALFGGGVTVPWLLHVSGSLSWQGTFLIWAGLAGISGLLWLVAAPSDRGVTPVLPPLTDTLRRPELWRVSLLFVGACTVFFAISSWLPAYYHSLGWSLSRSSTPLAVFNAAALGMGVLAPVLSDRLQARRPLLIPLCLMCLIGIAGLLTAPLSAAWLWSLLLGAGNDGVFALCLVLPIDLARRDRVGSFTGVMLTCGYGAAVIGPLAAGYLRDLSGSYLPSLAFIGGVGILMLAGALMLAESHPFSASIRRGEVPAEPTVAPVRI